MNTILLDQGTWDLVLTIDGNIAVASDPYALAQDAASAIRTFLGEVYYNTTLGIDYFGQVLGHTPPLGLLKALLVNAAKTVPGVVAAEVRITSLEDRNLQGQVQITNVAGTISLVEF